MTINSNNNDPSQLKHLITNILEEWEKEAPSEENRREAVKRILDFFNCKGKSLLDLSHLNLSSLPDVFSHLSELEELNLNGNRLTTLLDAVIDLTAAKLKIIHINSKTLTTLFDMLTYRSILTYRSVLTQKQQLDHALNQWIEKSPSEENQLEAKKRILDFFNNSTNQSLNLSSLNLSSLPDIFNISCFCHRLKQLDLSENQLTALPDTLGNLAQLTQLDLSTNQLTTLPDTLGNLPRLTQLNLSVNQLITLSDTLGNLAQLIELDLSTNQLTALPDTLGNLSQLTWLDLNTNQLTTLPDTLSNLSRLIELDLSTNQLTTLPDTLGSLAQLTWLGLSTNQLTTLPETLSNLSRLKTLELSDNYSLTKIPMKLLELPETSVVILRGSRNMDPIILERLLTTIASFRYKGPMVILHNTMKEFVAMMYQLIKKPHEERKEFSKLEESEDLYLWLKRLFDIADFKKGGELQKELMTQVINYLTEANDNQEFRTTFDTIIHDAIRTCGDRMALSIIDLGVAHRLANVSFTNMHALADLLKGLWAIDMVKTVAEEKISVLRAKESLIIDEVEIYLGYLIKLKEDLHLPVNMQNMLFFDCSQLTPDDLEMAKAFVLSQQSHQKAYFAFLNSHDKWITALSTHYKEEYQAIVDTRENSANLENPDYVAIEEDFHKQLEVLTEKALSRKRALLSDSSLNESKRVRLHTLDAEAVVNS